MRIVVYGSGGYWGHNYVRELVGHLVATVEPNKDRAEWVRQKYNVPTYPELPEDIEYDAVVICTPPDTHVDLTLPHLEAGKLALVEKPLAHSVEDAERLKPYADQIMSGLVYLYHPAVYYEMKDWVATHELDHVYARRSNCGPVRPWANAMWDLAPHDISIANYLFGLPCDTGVTGTRDWSQLQLVYPNGVEVAVYVSWLGHHKVRTIELVPPAGSNVGYTFDDVAWSGGMEISPLRRMLDEFLDGYWTRCYYEDGLNVVRVLESCSE